MTTWGNFALVPLELRAPLSNSSNRSFLKAGGRSFAGFVLTEGRSVLIRGIGPGLAALGVSQPLQKPVLTVRGADGTRLNYDDPSSRKGGATARARTGALVGAFPTGLLDASTILTLRPGAYVADVVSADPNDEGEVLIEVYLLP